jgi:uncharacterized protein YkwD
MLRALVVSFAILVLSAAPSSGQATPPKAVAGGGFHEISSKQPNPQSNSAARPSSGEDSAAENELLQMVNKSRELAGAPRLRMEETLLEAARTHAQRMIASDRLEHQLPGEASLLERIALVSPLKMDRVGENLAYATCAPDANDVLMRSAPHRKNLLDRGFNVAGIAAFWSQGKLYVVQDFAHELPSHSATESASLVGRAIDEMRQQAGLPKLAQRTPSNLDEAACALARENHPNARLLATAYGNDNDNANGNASRKIITYTQGQPEILPPAALRMLHDPGVREFAVGSCYARNAAYPTGTYWVAILLY